MPNTIFGCFGNYCRFSCRYWLVMGSNWLYMVLENFRSHICFCRFLWIKFYKWSWVFDNYNMWYICCIMLLGRQYNRKKLCRVNAVCEYFWSKDVCFLTICETAKTKKAVVALTEDSADIEIFEGL